MGKAAGVSRRRRKVANPKFKKKSALKKQRNRQLRNAQAVDPDIKANWDKKRTASDNMSSMGLVIDANSITPIPRAYRNMGLPDPEELAEKGAADEVQELMQLGTKKKAGKHADKQHVAISLEAEALRTQPKNFKFGPELCKFVVYMIEKHGADFDKMAMDRKNRYQYSAGEMKRLAKKFMQIPANRQAYERAKACCV